MIHLRTIIITIAFLITACTSYHKQAETFYAEGNYFAAEETYKRILQNEPEDPLATENLRKARQKILETRLIEARQLRMAENYLESHRVLKDLIEKEEGWDIAPSGAAFSAQKEEMEYFFEWIQTKFSQYLKDEMYLRAKLMWEENERYFTHSEFINSYNQWAEKINDKGHSHCSVYSSKVKGPFSEEFWSNYCAYWGNTSAPKKFSSSNSFKKFKEIELKGEITGVAPEIVKSMTQHLLDGLKQTPYYDAKGGKLRVDVTGGAFIGSYSEVATMGVHNYNEDEPYTVVETVSYEEREPFIAYKNEFNELLKKMITTPYTDYRNVTKFREETKTKYRSVAKQTVFPKTNFTANYKLSGSLKFKIDGQSYSIPLNKEFSTNDSYYEASNPRIGLYSRPKELITETSWVEQNWQSLDTSVKKTVLSTWNSKYCSNIDNQTETLKMEFVFKCARGSHSNIVDIWSNDFFGMPLATVKDIVGNTQ
jgi:hypothetical protein